MIRAIKRLPAPIRRKAYVSRCDLLNKTKKIDGIEFSIASTSEDLDQIFSLIHDSYVECGYITADASGLRVRPFDLLPSTLRVIAKKDGEVIATMSLIIDSLLGLPLEEAFKEEARRLRKNGNRIAEISNLTVKKAYRSGGMMMRLGRIVEYYAHMAGCDRLLVAVSPNLTSFYQDLFSYFQLGTVRSYSTKTFDPVVLLCKDCSNPREGYFENYGSFPDHLNFGLFWDDFALNHKPLHSELGELVERPRIQGDTLRHFLFGKAKILAENSIDKISGLFSLCGYQSCEMKVPVLQPCADVTPRELTVTSFDMLRNSAIRSSNVISLPQPRTGWIA